MLTEGRKQMNEFLDSMNPFVIERGTVEILEDTYQWWVVRQEFKAELPGFVGISEGILFIADTTPSEYREYIFWHEVMCVVKRGRKGCSGTVRKELERVPKRMLADYIRYRFEFFRNLVLFFDKVPPPFYGEIVQSRNYLAELLRE